MLSLFITKTSQKQFPVPQRSEMETRSYGSLSCVVHIPAKQPSPMRGTDSFDDPILSISRGNQLNVSSVTRTPMQEVDAELEAASLWEASSFFLSVKVYLQWIVSNNLCLKFSPLMLPRHYDLFLPGELNEHIIHHGLGAETDIDLEWQKKVLKRHICGFSIKNKLFWKTSFRRFFPLNDWTPPGWFENAPCPNSLPPNFQKQQ